MGLINHNAFKKTEIIEMVKKGRNQWHTIHLFKLKNMYTYF